MSIQMQLWSIAKWDVDARLVANRQRPLEERGEG